MAERDALPADAVPLAPVTATHEVEWGARWSDGGYCPSKPPRSEEFAREHARMFGTRPIRREVGPWVYADTGEPAFTDATDETPGEKGSAAQAEIPAAALADGLTALRLVVRSKGSAQINAAHAKAVLVENERLRGEVAHLDAGFSRALAELERLRAVTQRAQGEASRQRDEFLRGCDAYAEVVQERDSAQRERDAAMAARDEQRAENERLRKRDEQTTSMERAWGAELERLREKVHELNGQHLGDGMALGIATGERDRLRAELERAHELRRALHLLLGFPARIGFQRDDAKLLEHLRAALARVQEEGAGR